MSSVYGQAQQSLPTVRCRIVSPHAPHEIVIAIVNWQRCASLPLRNGGNLEKPHSALLQCRFRLLKLL